LILPLPVPASPLVIVIQGALLAAFHVQPPPVDTVTVPAVAAAEWAREPGEMDEEQVGVTGLPALTDSRHEAPAISGTICCLLHVENCNLREVDTQGFMM
jgi:hypothetical protein